ncbi:6-phospho-3-hexuloisomerase [Aureimonas frigidaquae]|uniref:6-phospho-3-hexuloisomerase n=1 Tax=Aureimonas frigidaquae TaxID=424757 RepID=UPI000785C2BF|nr:6-phospho-3-hexuloisomerase [Aureimonas frigidaquae]
MNNLYTQAVQELSSAVGQIDDAQVDAACRMLGQARHICVYAGGREGLQLKGFAMRLFHLGRSVSVVGDMTTPALGQGDVFLVVCGPGEISTSIALIGVAKAAGAQILVVTAQPSGRVPQMADLVVTIPAQTMADDQGEGVSVLPMGSLFEGALFVLFEVMVLKLKDSLAISAEAMRANHTNME